MFDVRGQRLKCVHTILCRSPACSGVRGLRKHRRLRNAKPFEPYVRFRNDCCPFPRPYDAVSYFHVFRLKGVHSDLGYVAVGQSFEYGRKRSNAHTFVIGHSIGAPFVTSVDNECVFRYLFETDQFVSSEEFLKTWQTCRLFRTTIFLFIVHRLSDDLIPCIIRYQVHGKLHRRRRCRSPL